MLFASEFGRNALVVSLLASVLCGIVGTFVVLKRLVSITGGISHAALGGLGAAYCAGIDPRWGGLAVAIGASLALGAAGRERWKTLDAGIGVLWAVGMAVGILLISLTPGYAPNLMGFLFGNVLLVSRADVWLAAGVTAGTLIVLALFAKEFLAVGFDEEYAQIQGLRVRLFSTLLLVLAGLTVIVLIQVVGIILVIALLTIPPLASLALFRGIRTVLAASVGFGALMTTAGLFLSFQWNLPAGPMMVLAGAAGLGLVWLVRRARAGRQSALQ